MSTLRSLWGTPTRESGLSRGQKMAKNANFDLTWTQPNERAANLKVNDRHHTTLEGAHTTCLGWDEAKRA